MQEGWFREQKYFIKGHRLPNGETREIHKPTKEQLLEQYAYMPLRGVLRVDALALCAEGVIITSTPEYEPSFENPPVRLLLAEGTDRGVAQFYIAEIAKMLDEDWHRLDENEGGRRH